MSINDDDITTSGPAGNSALLDNLRNILADARLPSSAKRRRI